MLLRLLEQWDQQLFLLINKEWVSPLLDVFFLNLTNLLHQPWFLYVVLPAVLIGWLWQSRTKMIRAFLAMVVLVAVTDSVGYRLLKPHVDRPRPNHIEALQADVKMGGYGPRSGSFPSNHALNTFALAYLLTWFYPSIKMWLFLFASLTAYSRVYSGVHFPSDVIGGAVLGLFIATLMRYFVFVRFSFLRPGGRIEGEIR